MEMDLSSRLNPTSALDTQAISTDTTTVGNIIDSQGYESIDFSILSGTLTDGTYTATLEDGDAANLSDAATVSTDFIIGSYSAFADTDDNSVKHFGYVGKKRYVRLSIVSASTSTGGTLSAVGVRGNSVSGPDSSL